MVLVLVGGTYTVDICLHWSRGLDFREPSYSRAIAYATVKLLAWVAENAVLNFVQSNFMENVNG